MQNVPFVIPLVAGILAAAHSFFLDRNEWQKAVSESFRPLSFTFAAVWITVTSLYFYNVARTVFDEHENFVKQTRAIPAKDREIEQLKIKLRMSEF